MTEDQATFFDRIYPEISRRLGDLEDSDKNMKYQIVEFRAQIRIMELVVEQYKKKIRKIEQLLIEHGLTHLLKGSEG